MNCTSDNEFYINCDIVCYKISSQCTPCIWGEKSFGVGHLLGRSETKDLLKVQLGEETDSKLLLGTYQCTDVPGEFVWSPGMLTKVNYY